MALEKLSRHLAFKGEIVDLYKDTVKLPDGKIEEWDYVHHKKGGGACIVPVLPDGRILMIRQYRPAIDETMLELPAGAKDAPDEDPAETARRELLEETGCSAESLQHLATIRTAAAYCNEMTDIYLADPAMPVQKQHLDEAEEITTEFYSLDELLAMISAGDLTDAKSVCGILAYAAMRKD